jgi:hypothetical protein
MVKIYFYNEATRFALKENKCTLEKVLVLLNKIYMMRHFRFTVVLLSSSFMFNASCRFFSKESSF